MDGPTPHRLDAAVPFGFAAVSPDGRAIRVCHTDRARLLSLLMGILVVCFLVTLVGGTLLITLGGLRAVLWKVLVGIALGPPLIALLWIVRRKVITDCLITRDHTDDRVSIQGVVRGATVASGHPAEALTIRIQPVEVSGRHDGNGLMLWRGYLCQLVAGSMTLDLCAFPSASDCESHVARACLRGMRREQRVQTLTCIGDRRLV